MRKTGRKQFEQDSGAKVQIVGSGEAFDSGLGNTSYLFSGGGLPTVLFDCGYQIPERLWKEGLHEGIDGICFTHLHADHSFGVVPLLVRYWEEGRTRPLEIIGPRGTERFVLRLLDMGYPGFVNRIQYPLQFKTLVPDTAIRLKKLSFTCAATTHSVLNYTIRVALPGKPGASFAVSGDGQITEASKKLVADVDVLFQEIYGEKPEIPVHADLETVSAWISETQIKKVITSHFCRSLKGQLKKSVSSKSKSKTQWTVARPGLEISL